MTLSVAFVFVAVVVESEVAIVAGAVASR